VAIGVIGRIRSGLRAWWRGGGMMGEWTRGHGRYGDEEDVVTVSKGGRRTW